MLQQAILFAGDFTPLLQSLHLTLRQDPATDTRRPGGVLSYDVLALYADLLVETLNLCDAAGEEVSKRVIFGGHTKGSVQPCEKLAATFDTHRAIALETARRFRMEGNADAEELNLELPKLLRTSNGSKAVALKSVVDIWLEQSQREADEQQGISRGPRPLSGAEEGLRLSVDALSTLRDPPEQNPKWITRAEADAKVTA